MIKRFLLLLLTLPLGLSCSPTEPQDSRLIKLVLEDVSCTEAWIQLTVNNLQLPAELKFYKNDVAQNNILCYGDTLLYVDSLLPNQTYKLKAASIEYGVMSSEITVTTLDTTSHNFTFETWTFGTIGSSVLYDVAIIDENNIIAVGEIMVADSSPNGYTTFNAVHWDGNQWELLRIPYRDFGNHIVYGPLRTVFAFSDSDIWFCSYADLVHYNGSNYSSKAFFMTGSNFNGQVSKMWGTDKNNIYCVGRSGSIYHYNGTSWKKIESGTDLNINDIWGDYNEKTVEWEILAVASNYSSSWAKNILLIKNNEVQKLSTDSNPSMEPLLTTWFIPNRQYYVAGAGIYQKHLLKDSLWKHNQFNITTFSTTSIRGNGINDVVGVGAFGDFVHFNGVNWKNDYEEPLLANGSYTKVAIKNNLIVAVGSNQVSINSEAVILVGRR